MYIVVWDENGEDPSQECGNKTEVEDLVNDLYNDDSVDQDSIAIYKVEKKIIPEFKIKL